MIITESEAIMSDQPKPNVAASLFTIHKVISRSLDVSIESAQDFAVRGFPEEKPVDGFINYIKALISILHAHHLVEDELVFPYFKEKLPDIPYHLLNDQHQEMAAILKEIEVLTDKIAERSEDAAGLTNLKTLKKIRDKWHPHIDIEETYFEIQKVGEMLPVEEHLRLMKLFAEHSQKHSGPAYLTIPFVLYNLPRETREIMTKAMPSEVVEQLVPIVWKEKWESMTPFLLL